MHVFVYFNSLRYKNTLCYTFFKIHSQYTYYTVKTQYISVNLIINLNYEAINSHSLVLHRYPLTNTGNTTITHVHSTHRTTHRDACHKLNFLPENISYTITSLKKNSVT